MKDKKHLDWKERSKTLQTTRFCIQKILRNSLIHTHAHTNPLEQINEFGKVAEYKAKDTKISCIFFILAMNNMKIKLRNNFTYNSIGKNKLGINLTKEA